MTEAEKERAAVVAWLRKAAFDPQYAFEPTAWANILMYAARRIEETEHLKERQP